MSFVRAGRTQQQSKGKRPVRQKKATCPKRDWVNTVTDLSVHKLTPAELSYRHEIHKSHNKTAAQWELKEKALKRRLRHSGSPVPMDQASLSIIREVFSDQLLLQDVLARSDRAMAVVKDLFGDAPRRHTGHPSVTMAPNCDSDSELPVIQKPDPPTHLSLLSHSMMDQEALNELEISNENHREEDADPSCSSENDIIRRANVQKMKTHSRSRVTQQQKGKHPNNHREDRDYVPVTPCTSGRAPDQTALNATVAVRRVRSKQSQSEEDEEETSVMVSQVLKPEFPFSKSGRISNYTNGIRKDVSHSFDVSSVTSLSGDQSTLGLLQAMLGHVEAELDTLSPDTARASPQSSKQHRAQGLTGFSVALVSTLGRLVHLLKQREAEPQNEAEGKRLEEELKEQRGVIDALTAETMTLREEVAALQAGLQQRTAELEQRLDTVVLVMGGLGLLGEQTSLPQDFDARAAVCQTAPIPEGVPEPTQVSVSPAILLSPPRQTDNWLKSPGTQPVPLQHQFPPVDFLGSCEDIQADGSASSPTSLQLSRLPSNSSLISDLLHLQSSPGAMLAEIAELSRQNELIKAQLHQARCHGSGVGTLPSSNNERRRSSPISTGRLTPQSVEERRMCGSSGTDRASQHIQAPDEQAAQQVNSMSDGRKASETLEQATSSNSLSVNSVEQRLLELNKQSAAARSRLLELIEQQKQSVAVRGSPSVSPIPPSAFSPNTAAGEGSSQTLNLVPEREPRLQGGAERLSAGSDVSSRSFGFEERDGKLQKDKRREREGWFALSTHVK
ncbi:spindle and centriole-associated protein 1 [Melanotaenia boesemani]|uniref:spindle and centriole-associated protein 1 n=1 Tax=Melanotaenia boesemani TaxID=1250792 RepID=UPI001C046555|nr:spindle and centriole-associated protein 1 [Melanotaenia boesemani]XP_041824998.1 spindle and centriole-associated protein 1 [Melanotaenia boesemani]